MNAQVNFIAGACFLATLAIVAAVDVKSRRIPNFITFPLALCGVVYHGISAGWSGVGASAGGMAVGLLFLIIPYMLGGTGAGDVKLMAAVGAVVGISSILIVIAYTAICGLVYALSLYFIGNWRSEKKLFKNSGALSEALRHPRELPIRIWLRYAGLKETLSRGPGAQTGKPARTATVAYAVPIALGTFLFIAQSTFAKIDWVQ